MTAHLGTSIYLHKDPNFRCAGGPHYQSAGVLALAISRPIVRDWLDTAIPSLEAEIIAWIFASMIVVLSVVALIGELIALRRP